MPLIRVNSQENVKIHYSSVSMVGAKKPQVVEYDQWEGEVAVNRGAGAGIPGLTGRKG